MAPVIRALQELSQDFAVEICVTGQHREMLDQVLEIFRIKPDIDLNLMLMGQDLTDVCSSVLISLRDVFKKHKPDLVLVHGDTTTAMAAAMAAFYAGIPVGHIEAGLRTYDFSAPFPEEFNRQLVGKLAKFHFSPTEQARQNLIREGVPLDSIWVTGNTVIDSLKIAKEELWGSSTKGPEICRDLSGELNFDITSSRYILITGHRRENFGQGFTNICNALNDLAENFPEIQFVYPVHLNPNVQKPVNEIIGGIRNIHLIEPKGYLHFLALLENCYFVLTDSGGIQEEAPSLGKPVLVMRETTERPEAVEAGTIQLVGTDRKRIVNAVSSLLENKERYLQMSLAHNPYGDGTASAQIIEILKNKL